MEGTNSRRAEIALTPFQRVLVGTDGTVTHLLEIHAGEPVEVVKLRQELDASDDRDVDLGLASAEKVLRRRVLLRGRRSLRTLLYAEAVVVLDRVDPAFVEGLLETDKPIGILLTETRTETFREILVVGSEPAGPRAAYFAIGPADEVIFRTYRVVAHQQPIMLITERFPAGSLRHLPG